MSQQGYIFDEKTAQGTSNGLVPKGKYEAVIERIEKKTTPNGKEKLSIMFRIRTDVYQTQGNRCVFEDIWKERSADYYNRLRINQLMGTQKPKDGTVFKDIDAVIQFLMNKPLIINVDVQMNDYSGEEVNTIQFYQSTENPFAEPKKIGESPKKEVLEKTPADIDEDDLPF